MVPSVGLRNRQLWTFSVGRLKKENGSHLMSAHQEGTMRCGPVVREWGILLEKVRVIQSGERESGEREEKVEKECGDKKEFENIRN